MKHETFRALNSPFASAKAIGNDRAKTQLSTGVTVRAYSLLFDALDALSIHRSTEFRDVVVKVRKNVLQALTLAGDQAHRQDYTVDVPVLDPAQAELLIKAISEMRFGAFDTRVIYGLAAILAETNMMQAEVVHLFGTAEGLPISIEIGSYQTWAAIDPLIAEQSLHQQQQEFALSARLNEIEERSNASLANIRKSALDLKELAENSATNVAQNIDSHAELKKAGDQMLVDLRTAAYEAVKYNAAGGYWTDHANTNSIAFLASAVILAAMLLVVPAIGLVNIDEILQVLRHISDVTAEKMPDNPSFAQFSILALNRLVVVSVPLILYFWAIKLVAKVNMRALTLRDDARHRSTMLTTYIQLIEKGAASKDDRSLVLTALFRSAASDKDDGGEMPDVAAVVSKVIGAKS